MFTIWKYTIVLVELRNSVISTLIIMLNKCLIILIMLSLVIILFAGFLHPIVLGQDRECYVHINLFHFLLVVDFLLDETICNMHVCVCEES